LNSIGYGTSDDLGKKFKSEEGYFYTNSKKENRHENREHGKK
jgi:hypothetical protein